MKSGNQPRYATRNVPKGLKTRMSVEGFIKMQTDISGSQKKSLGATNDETSSDISRAQTTDDAFEELHEIESVRRKVVIGFDGKPILLLKLNEWLKEYRGITNVELGTISKGFGILKKETPIIRIYANVNALPGITKLTKTKRFLDLKTVDELVLEDEIDSLNLIKLIEESYGMATSKEREELVKNIESGIYTPTKVEISQDGEKELTPIYLRMLYDGLNEEDSAFVRRLEKAKKGWHLSDDDVKVALQVQYRTPLKGKPALLLREFDLYWRRPPELKFTLVRDEKRSRKQSSIGFGNDLSTLVDDYMKSMELD